jgi:hypothetical protein
MRTFRQPLRAAGYETHKDIIRLVREVKAEQAIDHENRLPRSTHNLLTFAQLSDRDSTQS